MRYWLLLLLSSLALNMAYGTIYRWEDESGNVHFSDKHRKNASKVILPKIQTFHIDATKKPLQKLTLPQTKKEKAFHYDHLKIIYPTEKQSIRSNNGDLRFKIDLSPDLRENDAIQLYIDNELKAEGKAKQYLLKNIDRGEHSGSVQVVNEKGEQLIQSASITFYLQRYSQLHQHP